MSAATQKITYYYTPAALIMAERNPSKHTLFLQEHKLQPVCDVANLRAGEVTFLVLPVLNSMDEKQEIKLLLPNDTHTVLLTKGGQWTQNRMYILRGLRAGLGVTCSVLVKIQRHFSHCKQ